MNNTPFALVTLSPEQMGRIRQHGISIELHPSREAKGVELYMRATLHCNGPAATRAVLDELFNPGTIGIPRWMNRIGGCAPNYLLVVGFFPSQARRLCGPIYLSVGQLVCVIAFIHCLASRGLLAPD